LEAAFAAAIVEKKTYGCMTSIVLKMSKNFQAESGQFLHVLCGIQGERILRRPYSLFDAASGSASLLVKRAGPGSSWLADREEGEEIDCMGPLGRPFSFAASDRCILIAGGAGIAPIAFLSKKMSAQGIRPELFWGIERGGDYDLLPQLLREELHAEIASQDGSTGYQGTVLELLKSQELQGIDAVYACGPRGMLIDLAEMASRDRETIMQFSFEERMACGIGACKGCVVPASEPPGGYLTVCKDGPVFDGKELDWRRLKDRTWQ